MLSPSKPPSLNNINLDQHFIFELLTHIPCLMLAIWRPLWMRLLFTSLRECAFITWTCIDALLYDSIICCLVFSACGWSSFPLRKEPHVLPSLVLNQLLCRGGPQPLLGGNASAVRQLFNIVTALLFYLYISRPASSFSFFIPYSLLI
ncbi:hypothetical protein V8C42DRAFT_140047 [Trichoderma barbatum]